MADDIGERTNLANENNTKRDELLNDLLAWFKSSGALLPTEPNPAYNPGAADAPKGKKGKKKKK